MTVLALNDACGCAKGVMQLIETNCLLKLSVAVLSYQCECSNNTDGPDRISEAAFNYFTAQIGISISNYSYLNYCQKSINRLPTFTTKS